MYSNLRNYRILPIIENYEAVYFKAQLNDNGERVYADIGIPFRYSDGTADSYVKRGFDEIYVQSMTRYENIERSYRIYTTDTKIDFMPSDVIYIGDRRHVIVKVLPLMNTNDNLRLFNYTPQLYREMSPKLLFLN